LNWIHLAQDKAQWRALVNTVINLRASQTAGNFLTSRATLRFSIRTVLLGAGYFGVEALLNAETLHKTIYEHDELD
jgi:MFS-type transporter involved in bile tolerance (Atg22 family)